MLLHLQGMLLVKQMALTDTQASASRVFTLDHWAAGYHGCLPVSAAPHNRQVIAMAGALHGWPTCCTCRPW